MGRWGNIHYIILRHHPGTGSGYYSGKQKSVKNHSLGHRIVAGSGYRPAVLFLLRTGQPKTAYHLPKNLQTYYETAAGRQTSAGRLYCPRSVPTVSHIAE